jgi:hypothetical protein
MNVITKLSKGMQRFANRNSILPLAVTFIAIVTVMERGPFGSVRLKELSGGIGMLDMLFGYNQVQVYDLLGSIGTAGRGIYIHLLGLDYIFAVVFMLLQSLMITSLMNRAGVNGRTRLLNLLPFLRSGLDILENCLLLVLIFNYPVKFPILVGAASTVTMLKWVVYGAIIAVLFTLGGLTARHQIQSHTKIQNLDGKTI